MAGGDSLRQIALGVLIHVQRHQIHLRSPPSALPSVAQQKPVDEVLRMRMLADLGADQRNAFALGLGGSRDPWATEGEGGGGRPGGKEGPAGESRSGHG